MSQIPSCLHVVNGVVRIPHIQRIVIWGVKMTFSFWGKVALILAALIVVAGGVWMTYTAGVQAIPAIVFWIIFTILSGLIVHAVVKMTRK